MKKQQVNRKTYSKACNANRMVNQQSREQIRSRLQQNRDKYRITRFTTAKRQVKATEQPQLATINIVSYFIVFLLQDINSVDKTLLHQEHEQYVIYIASINEQVASISADNTNVLYEPRNGYTYCCIDEEATMPNASCKT